MSRNPIFVNLILIVSLSVSMVYGLRKAGTCPSADELTVCGFTCMGDDDCSGESKCCRTACLGSVCVRPILLKENLEELSSAKPGVCPRNPGGPWVCSNRCGLDSDCGGKLKCCKGRCGGLACMKPEAL